MSQDGTDARRVVEGDSPRWSPDGDRFAYVVDETGDADGGDGRSLWIMEADGSTRRVLGDAKESRVDAFAWAPDGTRLAVGDGLGISIAQLDGGKPKRLSFAGAALASSFDWSPDGRELLVSDFAQTVALDLQSRRSRTISSHPFDGAPRWSPDGEVIALSRQELVGGEGSWLITIDADGGETELTSGFDDDEPAWSSDGERIYFSRGTAGGARRSTCSTWRAAR